MDDVPTGKIDSVLSADLLDKALTIEEKNTFSEWLRERWSEKDALMDTFYETGEFPVEKETQRVEMKIGFKDTFDDSVSTLSLSLSPFLVGSTDGGDSWRSRRRSRLCTLRIG